MLTPGNKKLGGHLIWGFGLPSGTLKLCPGMTATCKKVCCDEGVSPKIPPHGWPSVPQSGEFDLD